MDVVRAVGFGSSAEGSSSAVFAIADFAALAGDAGGFAFAFAFAFDFFFGGFFTEGASAATIRGPRISNVFRLLGARSPSAASCLRPLPWRSPHAGQAPRQPGPSRSA
jgi:hypothetical protein